MKYLMVSNSICRFKLLSNSFLNDIKEFISQKFNDEVEVLMLNSLLTKDEKKNRSKTQL